MGVLTLEEYGKLTVEAVIKDAVVSAFIVAEVVVEQTRLLDVAPETDAGSREI